MGAAVRAEYLRGKAAGLYDRLEHSAANEFARMSDEELRQVIVEQAQALEALGIDMLPPPSTPISTDYRTGTRSFGSRSSAKRAGVRPPAAEGE